VKADWGVLRNERVTQGVEREADVALEGRQGRWESAYYKSEEEKRARTKNTLGEKKGKALGS